MPRRRACAPAARSSTRSSRNVPSVTKDGVAITLQLNARPPRRPAAPRGNGRRGRRPVPHRIAVHDRASACPPPPSSRRSTAPFCDAAGDRPVTFRTLDIGGDKVLPYMKRVEEENPALGWRAIRIGLDRPGCCGPSFARFSSGCRRAISASCCRWWPTTDEFRRGQASSSRREKAHAGDRQGVAPPRAQARGHGGGALAPVPADGNHARGGRFPLDRHQRPDAVPLRRPTARTGASRIASIRSASARSERCGRILEAASETGMRGHGLRRDGRQALRDHGR